MSAKSLLLLALSMTSAFQRRSWLGAANQLLSKSVGPFLYITSANCAEGAWPASANWAKRPYAAE